MKHISVRVPWHDNGWNSHVCANPRCNTFCKQLPNIVNSKVDCEQLSCGIDWSKLTTKERPACAGENGAVIPCEQRTTIRYQVSEMSAF